MNGKVNELEKILSAMREKKFSSARKLLAKYTDTVKLSNPNTLESIFILYLKLHDHPTRHFLKHLRINKVPPIPIDTSFDIGRRFFYALYLLNKSGGMRLVRPYLESIIPNRLLDFRFLGGMYFYNYDFHKSLLKYQEAFTMLPEKYIELEHQHIFGNIGACHLYLEDYKSFDEIKELSLKKTNNHLSIQRVYKKYDLLKCYQQKEMQKAKEIAFEIQQMKNDYQENTPIFEKIFLEQSLSKNHSKKANLIKNLNLFQELNLKNIREGKVNPERYFGVCRYLDDILDIPDECDFIQDYKMTSYPYPPFSILGSAISSENFKEKGNPESKNYINFQTQEYIINEKKGIGLNNEIRAIYNLVRAEHYGLSFETLASLIYPHDDIAGLFLIKERIKQIIYRLKNHYFFEVSSKNYRAYASFNETRNIYITTNKKLLIKDSFSLNDFMEFYQISQSKAKLQIKRLTSEKMITSESKGRMKIYLKTDQ